MLCISVVYAVKWCPSVGHICDFVKTSNRILHTFSPSGIQTILVSAYQTLWRYSDGDPLTGASNAGGVVKNRDSWWIADYWSMTGGVRTTTATVQPAGYCTATPQWSCLSQPAWMTTTKRREENRFELYAAVNLKRNLCSTYCTVEATDWHEASHGLSATAGLLVLPFSHCTLMHSVLLPVLASQNTRPYWTHAKFARRAVGLR